MRKLALILAGFIWNIFFLHAQNETMTCHLSSTQEFALLAKNDQFKMSHEEPLPYVYGGKGEMIQFKTPDGKEAHGFLIKNPKPSNIYILVIHEWWGLNDYIKKESEQLYNELGNVNILALDMYDGQVATSREDAAKYMQGLTEERGKSIVRGALDYAGKKAKIGTIGWCFGGGWSLQASILAEKQGVGCVIYYGMPEKDVNQLKKLQAEVLGIFAAQDERINGEVVKEFENNMKTVNKKLTVKTYDAVHGFANPSNPKHDKEATADANKNTLEFFKRVLK